MSTISFKYTWCDYLTKCPHIPDIEVGSWDCSTCKHCLGMIQNPLPIDNRLKPNQKGYMKRYSAVGTGFVKCALATKIRKKGFMLVVSADPSGIVKWYDKELYNSLTHGNNN